VRHAVAAVALLAAVAVDGHGIEPPDLQVVRKSASRKWLQMLLKQQIA
jgi:hypothetical protein